MDCWIARNEVNNHNIISQNWHRKFGFHLERASNNNDSGKGESDEDVSSVTTAHQSTRAAQALLANEKSPERKNSSNPQSYLP